VNGNRARTVSFEDEPLIVVDGEDNVLAYRSKADVHDGDGILHRAFSVFLFDRGGRLLLQRRSADKRLWPLYWSNSCCSHPRRGETEAEAARRRIEEELGVSTALEWVFKFQYHAPFGAAGSERELCSVFLGRVDGPVTPNPSEVAESRWVRVEELTAALTGDPASYTPWLRLEWEQLTTEHARRLARYAAPA
jgi:isopentenyl-diphosphate delta-isomerase